MFPTKWCGNSFTHVALHTWCGNSRRATLQWFGHVERMNEQRLTKRIHVGNVDGKTMRGRLGKQLLQHVGDV